MNKGVIKFISVLIICVIFINGFSASYTANNIDNIAYVTAIGIDIGEDYENIKVIFEFTDDSTFSQEGSSEESEPIIDTVTATSISSAINLLNSYIGKEVNLAHCKVVVISQELAENGITKDITELMDNIEVRPTTNIIVTKCTAMEYIENSTSSLEKVLTKYYDIFPNSSEYTGYTSNITLGMFYKKLIDDNIGTVAILGNLNEEDSLIEGDRGTENIGLAVFKEDKFIGELTAMETLCHTLILGEVDSFLITLEDEKYSNCIDVKLYQESTPEISVDSLDEKPIINIKLNLVGNVVGEEVNDNTEIANATSKYLENLILEYLNKTVSYFECDLEDFANYAKSTFITTKDWENYNWKEKYIKSEFNITIDVNISSSSS